MTPAATPEPEDEVDRTRAVLTGAVPAPAGGAQSATAVRDPGSYRDPSGFVFRRDGVVLRQVQASFADDWDAFIGSGLYERLRSEGLVIAHEVVSGDLAAAPGAHRVIRPEPIDFISYPYEWSFSQLQDAALLTLRLQELAVPAGMSLRDASAYNIQFQAGRPVLIDSLSFERLEPGQPWVAYRQFCEHFLAPLALMARIDIRLGQLLRANLEGVPLDLAARLLPGRTRFSMGLGPHIHLHARAQRRHADDGRDVGTGQGSKAGGPGMTASRLATLVESLRDTVRGLAWRPEGTEWADYADNTSYDRDATAAKEAAVSTALEAVRGTRAWDLGANTGRYSRLATDRGYRVVSLDVDPAAVERHYQTLRKDGRKDILPLVSDLRDPSPARGWGNDRAGLAAGPRRCRHQPRAGTRPPSRHRLQCAACPRSPTFSAAWRRTPSWSGCPRRTPWCGDCWPRARTSSRTTPSRDCGLPSRAAGTS